MAKLEKKSKVIPFDSIRDALGIPDDASDIDLRVWTHGLEVSWSQPVETSQTGGGTGGGSQDPDCPPATAQKSFFKKATAPAEDAAAASADDN